jgi:pyrroloquinoline quinone biosynthesis protein E
LAKVLENAVSFTFATNFKGSKQTMIHGISNPKPSDQGPLPLPEPMPDAAAYVRERELCLAADPKKNANYRRYVDSARRSADVDYLPTKLDIENVSRCNFRCTMCQVSEWHKGQRADDMTFEVFKRIIDEQYGLVEIKLQGMGEPIIQRDPFFDMIRYARSKHIWVRTVTNASLLHLKDNYKKIIDSGVNELQISIDGADKETFESIRQGSVFERVVENCKLINAYCREQKVERTKMWTVIQSANRRQLREIVKFAANTGFKSMVFSLDITDWGQTQWRVHNREISVDGSLDVESARELVRLGEESGLKVAFWSILSKYSTDSADTLCPWPFERAYVSSDFRIVPCCMIANPDAFEFEIENNSFGQTWLGNGYKEFRRAHLSGNIPAVCQGCYTR